MKLRPLWQETAGICFECLLHLVPSMPLLSHYPCERFTQLDLGGVVELCRTQVHQVLDDKPVDREDWDLFPRLPIDLLTLEAEVEPGPGDEVHRLTDVDAGRETRMVGPREGQNVFTWHLEGLVHLHLLLMQVPWVDHRIDIEQYIGVLFEEQEIFLFCCFLEPLSVILWDPVPELGLPPVVIVNRIEHKIFIVPAES